MKVGTRVKGVYCGDFEFEGVIESERALTVGFAGCFEHCVVLDKPIMVFGEERTDIIMYTKWDGSKSSYTRDVDTFMIDLTSVEDAK
jgi:hypothetical protein